MLQSEFKHNTNSISLSDTHFSNVPSSKIQKEEPTEKQRANCLRIEESTGEKESPEKHQSICKLQMDNLKKEDNHEKESLSIDAGENQNSEVLNSPFRNLKKGRIDANLRSNDFSNGSSFKRLVTGGSNSIASAYPSRRYLSYGDESIFLNSNAGQIRRAPQPRQSTI